MTSSDELHERIQSLWQKHLPTMRSRLALLQSAIEALERGDITDELKTRAAQEAHKLAGSLGTFGLQSGSDAAAELERLLLAESSGDFVPIDKLRPLFAELKDQVESK